MSQRHSEYERMAGDTYVTPRWVYEALYTIEPWAKDAWDCAPVNANFDFLSGSWPARGIATNPPFSLADKFIRHALNQAIRVAMLLPAQFDYAKGRRALFDENAAFKAKYTLFKRIRWENLEQKKAGPSMNHSWFIWDAEWAVMHRYPRIGWL